MVEDYALRKLAKKKRKREGADERGKRVRTKKNKVRRICRGQCYKEPFAVRRPGQTADDVEQETTAQDDDEEAAQIRQPKAKRRRKASSQESVKQSTSINLHSRRSRGDNAAPAVNPMPESLASLPLGIQQFMRDQRLTGLTPIQERLATVLSHEQRGHTKACSLQHRRFWAISTLQTPHRGHMSCTQSLLTQWHSD